MSFFDRLLPAPRMGGFRMADYWVWCGSVMQGEDNRFHMFAARWPHDLPFFDGYKVASEVVHAVSDTAAGPYAFADVALPDRGPEWWDGRMTHNPTIHRWGDRYLLFYIGATYPGTRPTATQLREPSVDTPNRCYATIRIGMAWAESLSGPWHRGDAPILDTRPGKWDGSVVTNPAPCILHDGRILLYYRANTPAGLRIGAAMADSFDRPFLRISEDPVLRFEGKNCVEDPFVWQCGKHFEMVAKDIHGGICGEVHAGVHAHSHDGLSWTLCDPAKAYSRRIVWDDGSQTVQGCVERPQLLLRDGTPTHLFAATGDGPGGFNSTTETWNMVIPLRPEP